MIATIELGSMSDPVTSSCWVHPGWVSMRVMTPKWGGRRPKGCRASANIAAIRCPFQESRKPGALASGSGGGESKRMYQSLPYVSELFLVQMIRSPRKTEGKHVAPITRWVLAHKRIVTVFWVALTLVGIASASSATKAMDQKFSVPGKEGWETNVTIAQLFGGTGGDNAPIVPVVTVPAGETVSSPAVRPQ